MKKIKKSYEKWYIYLIFQVTFIFLTQIYNNLNFITFSSNLSNDFPSTLRSIFTDCFWRTIFQQTKMHIFENACKNCLKKLGILLKCREKFLAACQLLWKYWFFTIFVQIFPTPVFWEHQFSNKHQKVPIMLTFMNSKLLDDWQISEKQYQIFLKNKSYEISNTGIYIGEDLEIVVQVFYRCIQLDHEIYIKCKKRNI